MANYAVGVDAGGTKVAYGLFDGAGALVDRMQHPTDAGADGPAFADAIARSVDELLQRNRLRFGDLTGVGIAMPSFILFDTGYVCMTSAMPNIRDFPMLDYLKTRLPTRVVLDNDSNVAALAEHRLGAGAGSRHMVYVSASTGLGCGIIIEGKLFRGSYGWAGECGHMIVTPDEGIECGCRNQGCFMSYASGKYGCLHAERRMKSGEPSALPSDRPLTGADLLTAHNQGDALAVSIVEQMAKHMALCVFNVYQLLNINLFVFGGGLVNFGDALFVPMRREFDRRNHIPQPVEFRFARLKQDFGITGAALLVT